VTHGQVWQEGIDESQEGDEGTQSWRIEQTLTAKPVPGLLAEDAPHCRKPD